VLSVEAAGTFFARVAVQPHIPFQYPNNGCWVRAHEMCRLIEEYLDPNRERDAVAKVWAWKKYLAAATRNNPSGRVQWVFHVAPVLRTARDILVLDPSLFQSPQPLAQWLAVQGASTRDSTVLFSDRHAWASYGTGRVGGSASDEDLARELMRFEGKLVEMILEHGPIPYGV
jgi:hypothetical protein